VGNIGSGDGTSLDQVLINTDKTNNVTGGTVIDGFDVTTHHEDGTLDGLDGQIVLGSGFVVGTLDTDLHTGTSGTREDTTESIETTLIRGGNHLGDVQHKRTVRVTVTDTNSTLIISRTFVQLSATVGLGSDGRRQVDTDHLQKSITSGQELAHNNLEKSLTFQILFLGSKRDFQLLEKSGGLFLLEVHDGVKDSEDRIKNKHVESTLKRLTIGTSRLGGPLLGLGVEVVLTPKLGHHLVLINTKLLGITVSELT
jgi:hypothetical protein